MKIPSEKTLKILNIVICLVSILCLIYSLLILPYSIPFLILSIIVIVFVPPLTKFPSDTHNKVQDKNAHYEVTPEKEYDDFKKKIETEYEQHQEKIKIEYENHLTNIQNEYSLYQENIKQEQERYEQQKEDIERVIEYKKEILQECENIQKEHEDLKNKIQQDLASYKETLDNIKNEIYDTTLDTVIKQYDYADYDGITSEECKNKLAVIKIKERDLSTAISKKILDDKWLIATEKHKKVNVFKQTIRCYNAECNNIIFNLTAQNIDSQREKIARTHKSLNKLNESTDIMLPVELLELKLEELNMCYTYELKKQQETEEQREIRQQMLEEEKVRQEIEREKLRIQKEETQFKNEVNKLISYLNRSSNDAEKELYIAKIKELEEKLKLLEKDKENVFNREQNTRAGFVYVISNIGSFGEDVYKIGMTRRLIPMDRIKELSSASVPFPFDVHAIIFSDDAPALETLLHNHFRKYQVNMVNDKKEFFKVSLNEIRDVVLAEHNSTVKFTMIAEADEYRRTLEIRKEVN